MTCNTNKNDDDRVKMTYEIVDIGIQNVLLIILLFCFTEDFH
jgi:hypothetical protein